MSTQANTKILVVDDDPAILNILLFNLKNEGYETLSAEDGEQGLHLALTENPDLVLLDMMMPKMNGFDVCKKIRETSQVPIIMITARAEETDQVMGFELGADDYITKPFGVKAVMSRVKANLRRSGGGTPQPGGRQLNFGALSIDLDLYEVKRGGETIDLTRREFSLVKFLATQNSQVFSREQLLEKVWGYEHFGDLRTVDVTIRRLRSKLEVVTDAPQYVLTKRGIGYHFTTEYGITPPGYFDGVDL